MNTQEAAALLAVAAAFDNRKPDADAAMAWAAALGEFEFNSCRDAVVAHYRESRDWIMPADVVSRVRIIGAERMRPFGTLVPPAHLQGDIDEERKWVLWARDEILSGRAKTPADIHMDIPAEVIGGRDDKTLRLANPVASREVVARYVAEIRAQRIQPTEDDA